jgi:hypothetical protein
MTIVADTHLHVYPFYDAGTALSNLARRLAEHDAGATRVGVLTERDDCRFFRNLRAGDTCPEGCRVTSLSDDAVSVRVPGGEDVILIAGRQIVTRERIEILALTRDRRWPQGESAEDVIRTVRDADAVPVIAWAPGKWFGQRGTVVRRLIEAHAPGELLLGDTSLRPPGWAEPRLMRAARRRGLRVLAGSDPLPFGGEESRLGMYVSRFEGPFDAARPAASLRALLADPETVIESVGRRSSPLSWAARLLRNAFRGR